MSDLAVIVPTRGRPANIHNVLRAWDDTDAWTDAQLVLAIDADDTNYGDYVKIVEDADHRNVFTVVHPKWMQMVPKLNRTATMLADQYFALGFAGDDHLPRTMHWARRYVETLRELRHGIVYCDDLYQGPKLPTQWAMTSSIVNALGRMVPAPVDHLYCDNAVLDLGKRTNCIRYLSDVVIEHMHYVVGKAQKDSTYARVNSNQQYQVDGRAYRRWAGSRDGLALDVRRVQRLRGGTSGYTSRVRVHKPTT